MEEKTEKPSVRKLKKARAEGNVAQSSELCSALILFAALLLIWGCGAVFLDRLKTLFNTVYSSFSSTDIEVPKAEILQLLLATLILLATVFCVGCAAHFLQRGWVFSWNKSKGKSETRFIFLVIKLSVIALVSSFVLIKEKPSSDVLFLSCEEKVIFLFHRIFFLLLKISIALVALGLCDFIYQKYRHYLQLHMTKQEVKEERRETEGDQQIKSKMRAR